MENSITLDQPTHNELHNTELLRLPVIDQFLPTLSPVLITATLWRKAAGAETLHSNSQRVDELCFNLTFALLGFLGYDREKTQAGETLLVPVAFDTEKFAMRLTVHRLPREGSVLILSLPEEEFLMPSSKSFSQM